MKPISLTNQHIYSVLEACRWHAQVFSTYICFQSTTQSNIFNATCFFILHLERNNLKIEQSTVPLFCPIFTWIGKLRSTCGFNLPRSPNYSYLQLQIVNLGVEPCWTCWTLEIQRNQPRAASLHPEWCSRLLRCLDLQVGGGEFRSDMWDFTIIYGDFHHWNPPFQWISMGFSPTILIIMHHWNPLNSWVRYNSKKWVQNWNSGFVAVVWNSVWWNAGHDRLLGIPRSVLVYYNLVCRYNIWLNIRYSFFRMSGTSIYIHCLNMVSLQIILNSEDISWDTLSILYIIYIYHIYICESYIYITYVYIYIIYIECIIFLFCIYIYLLSYTFF